MSDPNPERERAKQLFYGMIAIVIMLVLLIWAVPAIQSYARCQNLAPVERFVTRGC